MSLNLNTRPLLWPENRYHKPNTFKGAPPKLSRMSKTFHSANVKEIWSYGLVDFFAMVVPRTLVDLFRNLQAGIETFIRELVSNIITCVFPGIIAYHVLAKSLGPLNKVSAKFHANTSTLELMHDAWKKNSGTKNKVHNYVGNILNNSSEANEGGKSLAGNNHFIKELSSIIENNKLSNKEVKQKLASLKYDMMQHLKGGHQIKVKNVKDPNSAIETPIDNLLRDTHDLGKKVFKGNNEEAISATVKKLKSINGQKAWLALAIIGVMNVGFQFFNRHLTKMRTGSDEFVGLPGFGESKDVDNEPSTKKKKQSTGFIMSKIAATAGIIGIGLATAAGGPKNFTKILKARDFAKFTRGIEFTGMWPGVKQLAIIYMTTISGRVLSSRDKNELRETVTRDYLGFFSWLVLGGFVSKLVADSTSKGKLMNISQKTNPSGILSKLRDTISNKSLKTHEEIALSNIANKKSMYRKLNISIASGLLYSSAMLGIFIPLLNKTITEFLVKREREKTTLDSDIVELNNKGKESGNMETQASLSYNQPILSMNPRAQEIFSGFNQ